jgi:hypothetical protein
MAIACCLLVTFFPLLPLLRMPRLRLRIADSTSFEALFEVFRLEVRAICYLIAARAALSADAVFVGSIIGSKPLINAALNREAQADG